MLDWKTLAQAIGLPASGSELEALVAPLMPLDPEIRKAAARLDPGTELALIFHPDQDAAAE